MIKYLGSKRRLVPVLEAVAAASGARSALDLFTGTTRVAQAFKRLGIVVTAVDLARYAEVFARCYVETDATAISERDLSDALGHLNALGGTPGYVTETFCRRARFFQPFNGERIDAVRDAIAADYAGTPLEPVLLTSLIEAADRVDSTVGLQMAFVKQWAPRSYKPLELLAPQLLAGHGHARLGDARVLARGLGSFDLAYLDPPYNQHRYFTNYHVWETLVAWDAPAHYGVACKRLDARDPSTRSEFNSKRTMPAALAETVASVDCGLLLLSYNDESWVGVEELEGMCSHHPEVVTLAFASARYVGARIGIHDPAGVKVGKVSHLYNREYLVLAGAVTLVRRGVTAAMSAHPGARSAARR
ncbi:MAG TPA: DNA adenine methylase [Acidimicrobiales bacterium]|nr:DNA adenine methylase [Acidimicrobiales bacterium]